jgi:sterol desaturase/sphingolipid hydroxylase (fatty acid hydroxylase superfamily)
MYDDAMRLGPTSTRLVANLAFPVVTGAALVLAIGLMNRGIDPIVAFVSAQIPAFLAVIGLERLAPYHSDWNRNHQDISVDVRHLITVTLTGAFAEPVLRWIAVMLATWLLGDFALGVWPSGWPLVLQLALALVIGELGQYWAHRLGHEVDWLWRFHALHHSAPRLYWLNAARFHPVDILIGNAAYLIPLVALGAGRDVLALWILFAAIHGVFQHCNVPVRIGPLNWIFSMAELHRWHHSRLVDESNTNYGQNLIVWDVVFGTRFLPADRQPPLDIGLAGLPAFPTTFLAQELSPLHWNAIKAGRGAVAGPLGDSDDFTEV